MKLRLQYTCYESQYEFYTFHYVDCIFWYYVLSYHTFWPSNYNTICHQHFWIQMLVNVWSRFVMTNLPRQHAKHMVTSMKTVWLRNRTFSVDHTSPSSATMIIRDNKEYRKVFSIIKVYATLKLWWQVYGQTLSAICFT